MVNQKTALHKEVAGIFHDVWPPQIENIQQQSSVTSTGNVANFQSQPLTLDHYPKKAQSVKKMQKANPPKRTAGSLFSLKVRREIKRLSSVSKNLLTNILRAKDIIRPFNLKKSAKSASSETAVPKASEIPKFDIAEQIMAEHRKNALTKRKAQEAIDQKAQTIDLGPKTSSDLKGVRNVIEGAQFTLRKTQYKRDPK